MSSAGVPRWADPLLVVATKLAASALVLQAGFRAISDDDYSRIVIAQRFAEAPHVDPSGTSWLPFPFWVHGVAHALFGSGLEVARATALLLGVGSALLVWGAARLLGASRLGAVSGAAIASIFPYSAWLGSAAVPEALTAGLVVFGAATLAKTDARVRSLGALSLLAASLSRYEAWPVALVFAVFSAADARRERRLLVPALLALAGPLSWLLHGIFVHHDALFFLDRVSAYRAALGGAEASLVERVTWYPLAFLRFEPELTALGVVSLVTVRLARLGAEVRSYGRPLLCLFAVLLFLVWGSLRGGVPTHHAERALLALWFGLALFCGDTLIRAWRTFSGRARLVLALAGALELTGGLLLRPYIAQREAFSARDAELEMGREARLLDVPELLVASDDYGYFAVMASFGHPSRSQPLVLHDPRLARQGDPFESSATLVESMEKHRARWLIAPRRHEPMLRQVGRIAAKNATFALMERER